jgi:hypothetical protein
MYVSMMNQEFYMYVKNKKMISQKWYYMKVFPKMGKGKRSWERFRCRSSKD